MLVRRTAMEPLRLAALLLVPLAACRAAVPAAAPSTPRVSLALPLAAPREAGLAAAAPGATHARLEPLVGRFHAAATSYAGAVPEHASGVVENRWILGRRFLASELCGEVDGAPFESFGLLGFDAGRGVWVATSCDTGSTSLQPLAEGPVVDAPAILLERRVADPATGEPLLVRDVTWIEGRDRHVFERTAVDAAGHERRLVSIVYTRLTER